ncbi:hypothetical protein HDU92_004218 [Lobulomyces angularis]|nr:hypothetical protein HDU92_004218 [Lobulomyces angularis]
MNDGFKIPLTPFSGPTPKLNNSNQIFSTPNSAPQPSKFKPLPQAFHSTGFLKKSKKNESRNLVMPDTPLKRKYQDQTCLILLETNNKKKGLSINQKQLHQLQLDEKKFNLMSSELRILNKDYFKNASVNSNGYHQNSNSQVDLNFNNPNNFYVNSVDLFDEKFILLEKLGSGSFAEVFKVVEKGTNVEYAIKKTKKVYQAHRDRMLKLEEVELMWEVNNSANCVKLINAWEQNGYLYMQMELCHQTLQNFLDNTTITTFEEKKIWNILFQLSSGVYYMHSLNILHLDLKPANILIHFNTLKISDFGMASRIPVPRGIEHEGDRTYMAPEILENIYTKKADVFSLGLIIFEIALQIVLPENGQNWHILREGKFDEFDFGNLSLELVQLIKLMLEPNYEKRCCIDEVLTMAKRRASFYGGF